MNAWFAFLLCVTVIGIAGAKLSRYGDIIAQKTGLGGAWVGVALLATATSLPELAAGVTSVTVANAPNIAVGNVLGSCVFNLLIIVFVDFLYRKQSIYATASQGNILSAAFGIMLIGLAGVSIILQSNGAGLSIGHVGAYTPIILMLYAVAIRTIFLYERSRRDEHVQAAAEPYAAVSLRRAGIGYAIAAAVVVSAGLALPFVAKSVANVMGWSEGFVGTVFVAFATCVPEIVATLAALRLGAVDMAISNLFGSNLFDIVILAIDDIAYLKGPLLAEVSPMHAASAVSAMIMTGVAIVGLLYRPVQRVFRTVGWVSIALFTVYLLNISAAYLFSSARTG